MVAAVRDSNPHVRYSAVVSLGRMGDQQVLEVIEELQEDRESFVADAATRALSNLQTRLGGKRSPRTSQVLPLLPASRTAAVGARPEAP